MRVLDGQQVMARIFIGESDKWHHQPLYRALVERLRKEGFAGATDLPVVVEVVDTEEQMQKLLPILDEMVHVGVLVTLEKVHVVRYGPGAG